MGLSVASGLGAFNAISDLLAGAAVTIGGVGLTGLEIPAEMPFGGEQTTVEHKLVGGGKTVNILGPQEDDISWSGIFTGVSAVSRALKIDALRKAGKPITLTWKGGFTRKVILKSFKASYASGGAKLPYKITCIVIPYTPKPAAPGLLSRIASDVSSAIASTGIMPIATAALQAVQVAMPVVAIVSAGSPAFAALSGAVGSASSLVSAAGSLAGSGLASAATAATAAGTAFGGAAGLLATSAAQDVSAAASSAGAFIGRAARNMGI